MRTPAPHMAIGLLATFSVCGGGLARAEVAAQSTIELEEVVVTARRRPEPLSRAPVAVMAFTGQALDRHGITNLQKLGEIAPGLNITTTLLIDSIFLRGVGSSPNDPGFEQQTGLFVDGIYYGNGRWVSSATFDSDSVEVLAGPQGVYFGKNTVAGAINITTRNPGPQFEGYAKVGYEFNASEKYAEAVISGPLSDKLRARLSARLSRMKGWAENDNTGADEPGGLDRVGRLTLAWEPTSTFAANLKMQMQKYEDHGPTARTILLNCAGPNDTPAPLSLMGLPIWGPSSGTASCERNFRIPGQRNLREGQAFTDVPAYTSALTLRWHNPLGELTWTSGYNHYAFETYAGFSLSSLDAMESRNKAKNTTASTELRYQSKFKGPLNVTVGAYFQSTDFDYYLAGAILPQAFQGAENTVEQATSSDGETQSYVADLVWNITNHWELDLGVRYTKEKKDSNFDTLSVAPNVAAFFPAMHFEAGQEFSNTSPQATVTWRPTTEFMAYAAYRTGFLSGGFAHAQFPSPFAQVADFLFGEEEVEGGEVGAKFALAERRLRLDTVVYLYRYDGLQVSTFQPASFTFAVENAGKSESKGIEVRAQWAAGHRLSLNSAVAYGSSKYERYIGTCLPAATPTTGCNVPLPGGGFAQDFEGYDTSFAPRWTGRLALNYESVLASGIELDAGVGVNFSSQYTVGDVLSEPGWQKYDARIAVDFGRWNAALIGSNLTNKAICNQAAARPLGGIGETGCWLDRGREVRFELAVPF